MNRMQFLLTKLAEEATEVAQIALKTQQFGLTEMCPNQPYTNAERIHQELDDLTAIVVMLNNECGFNYSSNEEAILKKEAKVNKYYQYSVDLGLVRK